MDDKFRIVAIFDGGNCIDARDPVGPCELELSRELWRLGNRLSHCPAQVKEQPPRGGDHNGSIFTMPGEVLLSIETVVATPVGGYWGGHDAIRVVVRATFEFSESLTSRAAPLRCVRIAECQ